MIEGDAGEGEEQEADEADRGTDPVPAVQLLQPEGLLLFLGLEAGRGVHWGLVLNVGRFG